MDRHKYVKVAYHGFRELTRDDRQAMYGNTLSRESYDEPDYALIDTLFSLAEAYLFMQLVDFKDAFPDKIPSSGNEYAIRTFSWSFRIEDQIYGPFAEWEFFDPTYPCFLVWQLFAAV